MVLTPQEEKLSSLPPRIEIVPLKFWLGPFRLVQVPLAAHILTCIPPHDCPRLDMPEADEPPLFVRSLPLSGTERSITFQVGVIRYIEKNFVHCSTDLTTTTEEYWGTFSGKTRSTLKRKLRKFEAASGGTIDIRSYRYPTEVDEFLSIAQLISAKTYQERLFQAGLPVSEEFRAKTLSLAEEGQVRAFILFFQGTPTAYLLCPIEDGRVIYQYLGFDPAFAEHSPGTILQLEAFKTLFPDPACQIFDFTEGDGAHKRLFATHTALCGNVYYFPLKPKYLALVVCHWTLAAADRLLNWCLEKLRLKQRLRTLLRRQT